MFRRHAEAGADAAHVALADDLASLHVLDEVQRAAELHVTLFATLLAVIDRAYRLPGGCDAAMLARQFYEADPGRVLWGSDWPHTGGSGGKGRNPHVTEPFRDINNMGALQQIVLALGRAEAAQRLLADNPTRLYGF